MILVISGYREFNDYKLFSLSVDNFIKNHGKPDQIIFGECRGTDMLAKKYVDENKIEHKIYYANWRIGLSAGPIRNNEMIKVGSHFLAFLSNKSKGTKQAIESAEKNKLVVEVVKIDKID